MLMKSTNHWTNSKIIAMVGAGGRDIRILRTKCRIMKIQLNDMLSKFK